MLKRSLLKAKYWIGLLMEWHGLTEGITILVKHQCTMIVFFPAMFSGTFWHFLELNLFQTAFQSIQNALDMAGHSICPRKNDERCAGGLSLVRGGDGFCAVPALWNSCEPYEFIWSHDTFPTIMEKENYHFGDATNFSRAMFSTSMTMGERWRKSNIERLMPSWFPTSSSKSCSFWMRLAFIGSQKSMQYPLLSFLLHPKMQMFIQTFVKHKEVVGIFSHCPMVYVSQNPRYHGNAMLKIAFRHDREEIAQRIRLNLMGRLCRECVASPGLQVYLYRHVEDHPSRSILWMRMAQISSNCSSMYKESQMKSEHS